jgi:hypothetical protein
LTVCCVNHILIIYFNSFLAFGHVFAMPQRKKSIAMQNPHVLDTARGVVDDKKATECIFIESKEVKFPPV